MQPPEKSQKIVAEKYIEAPNEAQPVFRGPSLRSWGRKKKEAPAQSSGFNSPPVSAGPSSYPSRNPSPPPAQQKRKRSRPNSKQRKARAAKAKASRQSKKK